jgi:hypothetical protein
LRSPPFERVPEADGVLEWLEWLGEPEATAEEPPVLLGTVTTTVEVGALVVLLWVTRVVAEVSEMVVAVVVVSALTEPEVAVPVAVVVLVVEGLEEDSVTEEDLVSVAVVAVEDELEVEPV